MASLKISQATKKYDEVEVIHGIDLDIHDGEFCVFVGPSGCGKSTLLRMISGLEEVTTGNIHIGENDVTKMHPADRGVAMVFQSYALYPHLTVRRNLETPLRLRDYSSLERFPILGNLLPNKKNKTKKIKELVQKTSETLKITELLDRKPGQLSGGQRQRAALGRAMVREPVAFLMDEPLSNLDAALRVHMRSELSELHANLKTTFVYVTHDQAEALTMSTRMAVMIDGKLLQLDTPQQVYDNPSSLAVAQFVGSPKINTIKGSANSEGIVKFLNLELQRKSSVKDSDILIGIRPEHLEISKENSNDSIEGVVSYRENLGSDMFFHIQIAGDNEKLIARGTPQLTSSINIGSKVFVKRLRGEALLFDHNGSRIKFTSDN